MQKSMMERRSMDDNQYTYLKVANSYNKNISRKIFEYLKIKIFDSSKIFFVSLKIYFLFAC